MIKSKNPYTICSFHERRSFAGAQDDNLTALSLCHADEGSISLKRPYMEEGPSLALRMTISQHSLFVMLTKEASL